MLLSLDFEEFALSVVNEITRKILVAIGERNDVENIIAIVNETSWTLQMRVLCGIDEFK